MVPPIYDYAGAFKALNAPPKADEAAALVAAEGRDGLIRV